MAGMHLVAVPDEQDIAAVFLPQNSLGAEPDRIHKLNHVRLEGDYTPKPRSAIQRSRPHRHRAPTYEASERTWDG